MACHLNFFFLFKCKKKDVWLLPICGFFSHSQPSIHISISWPMFFFLGLKLILIYSVGVFIVTQTPELVPLDWLFFHFRHFFYVIFIWWQWYKLFFSQNSWPNIIKWHFFPFYFILSDFNLLLLLLLLLIVVKPKLNSILVCEKKWLRISVSLTILPKKRVVYWWCMVSEGKTNTPCTQTSTCILNFVNFFSRFVLFSFLNFKKKKNTRILIKSLKSSSHMMMRMMLKKTNVDVFIHWL